jgi:predicted AAA+ superfamily ATPase
MGQLQDAGNVTTLAAYLDILDECALLTGLQKYARDDARKRGSVPKYQVYNNALLTAYKGHSFIADRTDTKLWGRWVESAIGTHILSMAEELDYKVYYWREPSRSKDESDKEVDFIIDNDGELTAIEVKSGRRGMNSGLPAFVEAFHPKRAFIVGTGGVSLEDFLSCDIESLLNQE